MDAEEAERILKRYFREYYSSVRIPPPPDLPRREFGIGKYGKKITTRHKVFPSEKHFWSFLESRAPLFISYSIAKYMYPGARDMEAKGFLGADFVFEFDVDQIPTPCKEKHDRWECENCGKSGMGPVETCPYCGSKTKVIDWVCDECLEKVKELTIFLIEEFLKEDLGVADWEISVNFSGARGYHIHIRKEAWQELDQTARIEILNYVTGNLLDPSCHGFKFTYTGDLIGPGPWEKGWGGRIARAVIQVLKNPVDYEAVLYELLSQVLIEKGFSTRSVNTILTRLLEKGPVIAEEIEKGNWSAFKGVFPEKVTKEAGEKVVLEFLALLASRVKASPPVDPQTSQDIRKLIRVPESLHGETGLRAAIVKKIDLFDPLKHATVKVWKGTQKVFVRWAPKFRLGEQTFGPWKNEEVEVPVQVAILLLGKGVAEWR